MRSWIILSGGERVIHIVKQLHYDLLKEIGYTFGNSVSLAVLG